MGPAPGSRRPARISKGRAQPRQGATKRALFLSRALYALEASLRSGSTAQAHLADHGCPPHIATMKSSDDAKFVCNACVAEDYLSALMRRDGERRLCDYCERRRKGWPVERLADLVHDVLDANYTYGRPESYDGYGFGPSGDSVEETIGEIIVADDERIAGDIAGILSGRFGYAAARDGEDDPYGDDVVYREDYPNTEEYASSWTAFRDEITSRNRFFSKYAQDMLESIFGDLGTLRTEKDESVIRLWGRKSRPLIYRGRVATSQADLERIVADPASELTAPPNLLARAGRMNSTGISVFYGALSPETCIAEIRPPVGSHVVVVGFEPTRTLRLLDLERLRRAAVNLSIFHPEYAERRARAAFLRRLAWELSRPVMPSSEELDYLPTQAVAEYLARLDGPALDG
ncbi:MAG TPA: RES domain-containing protein, partial [Allosphingosinicella sp.]